MNCILGINGYSAKKPNRGATHNTGACFVQDGIVLAAVDEERLSRVKNDPTFPFKAIGYLQTQYSDPKSVALAGLSRRKIFSLLKGQYRTALNIAHSKEFKRYLRSRLLELPIRSLTEFLSPRTVPSSIAHLEKREIQHHHAHAASAYYCCPWPQERILVITLDGFGDAQCGTCWVGEKGRMEFKSDIPMLHSIGLLYTAFTHHLGFKAVQHEGKIVGLAAFGDASEMYHRLMQHITLKENGTFEFDSQLMQLSMACMHPGAHEIFSTLVGDLNREDIAAGLQAVTEFLVCRWISHCCRKHHCSQVAVAGGVFANVKLNQRILELDEVENIYIHPNMGDGGLAVGAALALHAQMNPSYRPAFLETCYLGPEISDEEACSALDAAKLPHKKPTDLAESVADLLTKGKVVARAAGRMEYGPRALGNRSIFAACSDPSINQWLNERLNRTEFMPFAPIIMEEYAADYFPGWRAEHVAARFMTITYDASDLAKEKIPAAIHIDGTARPQVLRKQDNPEVYRILEAYHRRTGIPALINTSFNMHEEPIVCSAPDAVRAFQLGNLDALVCGNQLCVRTCC